jgi:hypothetical protein
MVRFIGGLLLSVTLLTGCTHSPPSTPESSGKPAAGVKVDVPGVKVDVEKDKGVKVNVSPKE